MSNDMFMRIPTKNIIEQTDKYVTVNLGKQEDVLQLVLMLMANPDKAVMMDTTEDKK